MSTPEQAAPKIGQGAFQAFLRQGHRELAQVLQAFPDSVPIIEEPGQIGTATPQAVSIQTGVSQPISYEGSIQPMSMEPEANAIEPMTVEPMEPMVAETEMAAPEVEPLDQLMNEISQCPECPSREQEMAP